MCIVSASVLPSFCSSLERQPVRDGYRRCKASGHNIAYPPGRRDHNCLNGLYHRCRYLQKCIRMCRGGVVAVDHPRLPIRLSKAGSRASYNLNDSAQEGDSSVDEWALLTDGDRWTHSIHHLLKMSGIEASHAMLAVPPMTRLNRLDWCCSPSQTDSGGVCRPATEEKSEYMSSHRVDQADFHIGPAVAAKLELELRLCSSNSTAFPSPSPSIELPATTDACPDLGCCPSCSPTAPVACISTGCGTLRLPCVAKSSAVANVGGWLGRECLWPRLTTKPCRDPLWH
ncbi:hypothetical protein QBC46DRAFT_405624 [Diplogelasinospora grovesii]|uniref:Uncharacterized protein n=1 Tax=Diplogelasinospora grovesii TaxID=303347 RepID=A0AAN6NE19_9PEZI|nr:hypothetical protein QBC46DRAFT_405624 [Diplogelasinospora grovesii]